MISRLISLPVRDEDSKNWAKHDRPSAASGQLKNRLRPERTNYRKLLPLGTGRARPGFLTCGQHSTGRSIKLNRVPARPRRICRAIGAATERVVPTVVNAVRAGQSLSGQVPRRRMPLAEVAATGAVSRSPERSRRETSLRGAHLKNKSVKKTEAANGFA
jgi:hypothetical protein